MNKKALGTFTSCILFFFIIYSSRADVARQFPDADKYRIELKWNKAYLEETRERVEAGLKWVFSFLGAEMKQGSFNKALTWNQNTAQVDLSRLGFSDAALRHFADILKEMKNTSEYDRGGIDMGRFIILVLNAPNHYYAITGAEKNITEVLAGSAFDTTRAALLESSISHAHRLVGFCNDSNCVRSKFVVYEGNGSLLDSTFKPQEYEVISVMNNGQLRFAVYGEDGRLLPASDAMLTAGGKVGKCLWCHEIRMLPPFVAKTSLPGYYSPEVFKGVVDNAQSRLESYRKTLKGDIDFNLIDEHTMTEILYTSFMEPSAERLAIEWGMHVDSVKLRLNAIATHKHNEFKFLGTLYDRKDIDALAPYTYIKVPESARERSDYEPDLLNKKPK
jgi:hypothetical protein